FKKLLKILQVSTIDVGYDPIREVVVDPLEQVITLSCYGLLHLASLGCCRPDKQVNEMLVPLINQSRHRPVIEIVKSSSNQRKSLARKIHHRGCEIELRIKPRLYRVLIRGGDIGEMVGHK